MNGASPKASPLAQTRLLSLADDLDAIIRDDEWVQWATKHSICAQPLSMARQLNTSAWADRAVIVTSATMPSTINRDIGLALPPPGTGDRYADVERIAVAPPFDYTRKSLLYCAAHLPHPTRDRALWEQAAVVEARELVNLSAGGALVLCTSTAAIDRFADALDDNGWSVLRQGESSKADLLSRFAGDEGSVLVATRSFWQGVTWRAQRTGW